ncbi:hypothetical protein AB0P16_11870 [Dietzia maris]|uniref:hypothetical protein n=1 Tax=Dietzia maris TaxID=37915 RepID=UPI0034172AE8
MTTITFDELAVLAATDPSVRDLITHSDSTESLTAGLAGMGLHWTDHLVNRPDYTADLHSEGYAHAGTSYAQNCPTYRTCGAAHPCKQTC